MKRVFAVLLALALPPAVYFPTLGTSGDSEIGRAESELREAEMHLEQARAAQRKLPQFHEELARLDLELTKLRTILPPAMGIDDLRSLVESKAAGGGVRLTKFNPRPITRIEELQVQTIEAEVAGGAEATSRFFRDLSNASRVVDVSYVTLRPEADGWRTAFVMTVHALPD